MAHFRCKYENLIVTLYTGLSQAGGPGRHVPPQFLADWLTLSQPAGAHYPHPVLRALPDFQTLRRPWYMFTYISLLLLS